MVINTSNATTGLGFAQRDIHLCCDYYTKFDESRYYSWATLLDPLVSPCPRYALHSRVCCRSRTDFFGWT
ncbi:hypothetical protein MVEN_00674400 [Mycena venus]|uniref:Uncharacterized protein n=1 Tax=Mycena venus TaxID=2733690 RepID=A0A8H6YRW0_9AGAR|nr:hypothetical protein MVEN_00674400 [Mycena venus]